MRVIIESDPETIEGLTAELSSEPETSVESSEVAQDLAEQKFGFAEVSAIITIVKGAVELASALKQFADDHFKQSGETKPQTLRLRTAVGAVVIEITPGTTLEHLQQTLAPLTAID